MRRGQLQTLEPVIIMVVLVIIVGLSLLFYMRISGGQQAQNTRAYRSQEDLATLARIANLPELSCGRGVTTNTYCIDRYKAESFGRLAQNPQTRLYYYSFFGATNVTLQLVENGQLRQIPLYANLNNEHVTTTRTYFTVLDPLTNTREFAILIIEREQ